MPNWLKLTLSLIIPQLAGASGALFTLTSLGSWYQTLQKPAFNPPGWLFGPVWTILYLLMGIACFLIWKSDHPQKRNLLTLYFVQLGLNSLWSPAFFGMQSPFFGLLVIIPLLFLIVVCVTKFKQVSPWATRLMVPYLIWVIFATVLNASIWWLN